MRIFTPRQELPFAGHPAIGSAHAVREAGIVSENAPVFKVECQAGVVSLSLDKDAIMARVCGVFCYQKLRDHKKTAEYNESIIRIDAQNSFAFYNWGVALRLLYMETKDSDYLEQAIEKYRRAIEIRSDYYEAYHDWGNVLDLTYTRTNELVYLKQAIEKYKKAIDIKADYPQAHFNLTYALTLLFSAERKLAILDDALMHAKKALECRPERRDYCYNIACVYALKEIKQEMLAYLKDAIEFDSKHMNMAREDNDFATYFDDPDFVTLTS